MENTCITCKGFFLSPSHPSLPPVPTPSLPQATTDLGSVTTDYFAFSRTLGKCNHIVCNHFCLASLSIIILRFVYAVFMENSFLFISEYCSIGWLHHNSALSIRLLDIGLFPGFGCCKKPSMSLCVQVSGWILPWVNT